MDNSTALTPKERTRITEIQDLLIKFYVEHKEALDKGNEGYAIAIEFKIRQLQQEIEEKRLNKSLSCLA